MNCHICGAETEFACQDCGQPVCEDCCVPYTQFNQCDFTRCNECQSGIDAETARENMRRWAQEEEEQRKEEEKQRKLEHRRKMARKRYWKPENIEKRRIAKIKRRQERAELRSKQLIEALKIVYDWLS